MKLEICCSNIESVENARKAGTDRIELCSALEVGGLTPSARFIERAVEVFGENVMVLIRPRSGDYIYSPQEIEIMLADAQMALDNGAAGIVTGFLTASGEIDVDACRRMREVVGRRQLTFHRAFDCLNDPLKGLAALIDLGYDRILTSGSCNSALQGVETIASLVGNANGKIKIMAGAGVSHENIREIVTRSGCHEVHASAKQLINKAQHMPSVSGNCDSEYYVSSVSEIQKLKHHLECLTE